MANPHKSENQRGRAPEHIRAFEAPVFVLDVQERPNGCRCTWVPRFRHLLRSPAGPSDHRPMVYSWHADGFLLKFRDVDCPVKRLHG